MALRLGLFRIWLLSLIIALVAGCGGHDDGDIDFGDAAIDIRRDTTSDRASDANTDSNSDVRTDSTPDASVDVSADTRVDVAVVDNRVDPAIDARVDPPIVIDVRVDPTVDVRVDAPVVDVRVDPPIVTDVRIDTPVVVDVRVDPRVDVVDAGGCTTDNQCDMSKPHCNVNTHTCVYPVALSVTPANVSIPIGVQQQYAATVTYSDSSTGDVTAQATWISSNTGAASMSNTTLGLAAGMSLGTTSISAIFSGFSGATNLTVTAVVLKAIQVEPANQSSPLGTTRQFTATGVYTDNSTQNITGSVTWTSSVPGFATIDSTGLAKAVAEGQTMISATVGAISNGVAFTVTTKVLARIDVTPPITSINSISTQGYTATGVYTDNSTVPLLAATWASSDTVVATIATTVTGATATALSAGPTTISATFGGLTGTAQLTVTGETLLSIDVTAVNPTIPVGFNSQFTAMGHFTNNFNQAITNDVLWESGTPATATISNAVGSQGLASALAAGTSNIKATLAGITGQTALTVVVGTVDSVTVTPNSASIPLGSTQQYTAMASFNGNAFTLDITAQASWSSTVSTTATVSNATGSQGLATAVGKTAPSTIVASYKSVAGTASLTTIDAELVSIAITPIGAVLQVGQMLQFTATGTYTDNTTLDITQQVTWQQAHSDVVDVNNTGSKGLVTAVMTGSSEISAELSMKIGVVTVTVP